MLPGFWQSSSLIRNRPRGAKKTADGLLSGRRDQAVTLILKRGWSVTGLSSNIHADVM
jgi:hypothetical protein